MKTLPLPRWFNPGQSLTPAALPATRRRTAAALATGTRETFLKKNAVLRLPAETAFARLAVESGIVWVTAAPGDGDIILQPGQSLPLRGGWPVVLQALTEASFRLIQSMPHE